MGGAGAVPPGDGKGEAGTARLGGAAGIAAVGAAPSETGGGGGGGAADIAADDPDGDSEIPAELPLGLYPRCRAYCFIASLTK